MTQVRGCEIPDDLLYDIDNNIWYKENDDGSLTIGMTSVAMAMAGPLLAVTPKKVGKAIKPGKSCATVESGKWVGPAKLASGGEVTEINDAIVSSPATGNSDPYGAGWLLKVKPEDWDNVKQTLVTGADSIAPAYEAKMAADGFAGCAASG